MPIESFIPNKQDDKWEHVRAVCHMPLPKNDKNPFQSFLEEYSGLFLINGFRSDTHETILKCFPGSGKRYKATIDHLVQFNGRVLNELETYRCMLYAIVNERSSSIRFRKCQYRVEPILSPKEGNNRSGALIHAVCNAKFDATNGQIVVKSMTTDWIIQGLVTEPDRDRAILEENLKDIDIEQLIGKQLKNPDSVFNKTFWMDVNFGVTVGEFEKLDVSIAKEAEMYIRESELYAKNKLRAVSPPQMTEYAKHCLHIIEVMEENEKNRTKNEMPTFAVNGHKDGKTYVEFAPPMGWKTPRCNPIHKKEAEEYQKNPSKPALEKWMKSITMGVAVFDSKNNLVPNGKKVHPLFRPCEELMLKATGKRKPASRKKAENFNVHHKATTLDGQKIEKGEAHLPLCYEDLVRAVLIRAGSGPMYRGWLGMNKTNWTRSQFEEECMLETDYLLRTICRSEGIENYGRKLTNVWKEENFFSRIGHTETIITPDKRYLAANVFLADALIACLQKGFNEARAWVRLIANVHHDIDNYQDRTFIEIVGKCLGRNVG